MPFEGLEEARRNRCSGANVDCRRGGVGRAGDFGPALGRVGEAGVGGINEDIAMGFGTVVMPVYQ